jgi:hypothetical protein
MTAFGSTNEGSNPQQRYNKKFREKYARWAGAAAATLDFQDLNHA